MKVLTILAALAATALAWQGHDSLEGYPSIYFDNKAINYLEAPSADPVARLSKRLEKGEAKLEFQTGLGYLPSLLKNLGMNPDSQLLVFSKTSFQASKISPQRPRAVYFGDDVSVGFVQSGDVMEVMGLDPALGYVFYTLDTKRAAKPEFVRRNIECLQCHQGPATLSTPGMMVSSAITGPDGTRVPRVPAVLTDQRVAFANRWGGWYVTGTHGSQIHNGNAFAIDSSGKLDRTSSLNVTNLRERIDTGAYAAPTSDIVALMTLEHQTTMTNLLIRIAWETKIAQQEGKLATFGPRLDTLITDLLKYMTFAEEVQLRDPVKGVSAFTQTFPARGPRDKKGRGLRDFDLTKRLFRYPLSYMIYSASFDGLPPMARDRIYQRLYNVLIGKEAMARLTAEDRAAILEILRDTKPGLPAYWKS